MNGVFDALARAVTHFGDVHPQWVLAALACHLANHGLRSVAWRNVIGAAYPERRVDLLGVASAYATGVALNAVLPGRGGDAAKVALVRSRVKGSNIATIVATMSVLMAFDLVAGTVLVTAVAVTGSVPFAPGIPAQGAGAWATDHVAVVLGAVLAGAAGGAVVLRRLRGRLVRIWSQLQQGGAILRTPRTYLGRVALVQAGSWACRVAVVACLLAAFGLPASVLTAGLVMVLCGASTLVPLTPGGAGTQQVMLAYAFSQTATAAAVISFSVGMQAGVTAVNALLGMAGAMIAFRTVRPLAALRAGVRLARQGT